MRPLTCFIAAGMLAAAATPAGAAQTAYGTAFDALYRIDLETRQATTIGRSTGGFGYYAGQPIVNLTGLTTLDDGTEYAVSGAYKLLLRVDPGSGSASVVGTLALPDGTGQFNALDLGMAVDCDGTAWLASGTLGRLWKVDLANASLTPVGDTGHAISGLVARDDVLYGTGSQGDHTFYRIDKSTGAATAIGGFGDAVPSYLNSVSMSFDDAGILWAALNYVPPVTGDFVPDWADLAQIDPATGAVKNLGPITGPDALRGAGMKGFTVGPTQCKGAAAAPLPAPAASPWTLALLGGLLALAAAAGFRRAAR